MYCPRRESVSLVRAFSLIDSTSGGYKLVIHLQDSCRAVYVEAKSSLTYIPSLRYISELEYNTDVGSNLILDEDKHLDCTSLNVIYKYIYYTCGGQVDKEVYYDLYGEGVYSYIEELEDEFSSVWRSIETSRVKYTRSYESCDVDLGVRVSLEEYVAYKQIMRIIKDDVYILNKYSKCGLDERDKEFYLGLSTKLELYYVLELLEQRDRSGIHTRDILDILHN